ncbi:hypothetical protein [Mesonia sp. K7]|uniref:hypothetical protein n=1 Tax=Mesonia sp. K7 TaxID=2218606 RepID=UPI000DAA29B2|nr:hypothetical protein [Mesonia sp. K7]PZD76764.1 hypothetical protein DNG35_10910 [Mesonia sp. K7]
MKTIINKIIEENNLKLISLDSKVDFTYYEEKDDFFIFLYYNQNEIVELNNNEIVDLEYTINTIIVELKKDDNLSEFKQRNLDHNLSLVLLLELENENDELRKELNKVEENSLNAKKYVLPYFKNDVEVLLQKINRTDEIVSQLNKISIENSDLLDKPDESWYRVLMGIFIKTPFLNYQSTEDNQSLENLSLAVEESLSIREKYLLDAIKDNDFNSFQNIEEYINQQNLTNDTNGEI